MTRLKGLTSQEVLLATDSPGPPQYEYKVLVCDAYIDGVPDEHALNELGQEGYRVVYASESHFVLMRGPA